MKGHEKIQKAQELEAKLIHFHTHVMPLTGIAPMENLLAFIAQIIDSIHRVEYVQAILNLNLNPARTIPKNTLFDPIKAAAILATKQTEEAFWMVFLATHCGRNIDTKWLLTRELYGMHEKTPWTWDRVSSSPEGYRDWLEINHQKFTGKFGNHRKYESLKPGRSGTGAVVASYVNWIKGYGSHNRMIELTKAQSLGDRRKTFALLYKQMEQVIRFGRTGKFDYLTMLAKLGLADIEAGSTYLIEATGPKRGARLLFDGQIDSRTSPKILEQKVEALERHLQVGMQVMEDSMCNWQKSPNRYLPFRG